MGRSWILKCSQVAVHSEFLEKQQDEWMMSKNDFRSMSNCVLTPHVTEIHRDCWHAGLVAGLTCLRMYPRQLGMSLKKVIEKKRSEECNTENPCEGYNTIRVLYEQTVMGGAVLTGMEPSGREREGKTRARQMWNTRFLKKQRKTYVSIYIWAEGTLKD